MNYTQKLVDNIMSLIDDDVIAEIQNTPISINEDTIEDIFDKVYVPLDELLLDAIDMIINNNDNNALDVLESTEYFDGWSDRNFNQGDEIDDIQELADCILYVLFYDYGGIEELVKEIKLLL